MYWVVVPPLVSVNQQFYNFRHHSVNSDYQVYTRCARDDYDAFAEAAGDPNWGWDKIFPYAIKASFLDP